ncbi:MAG: hypothetical protein Q4B86_00205 [Eubacteriales bacterium]|nr:hypothetical protein [Eubacteriales bacterium]
MDNKFSSIIIALAILIGDVIIAVTIWKGFIACANLISNGISYAHIMS